MNRYQAVVAVGIFVAVAGIGLRQEHATTAAVLELAGRIDKTTEAVRELKHAVAPKSDHVVCPEHDGHPEVDLGVPETCPDPADGQCVRGMPLSVAQARCQAGKL
jgi:hypothetical protein